MSERIFLWEGKAPYETDFRPYLTAFPAAGSKGAVIVCPGGGYCFRAPYEGDPVCEMLNRAGISAYTLEYRVSPCHMMAPLTDAKRAIRLVRSMGYEKVAILGFSAGGHLCCSAATLYDAGDPHSGDPVERLSSRPDAFVPCYAVASFEAFPHYGSVESLLGDLATDHTMLRRFSSELQVTCDTPEAFLWHTASDETVPVENSLRLAEALAAHGVPFELHVFPEGEHGLGLAEGRPDVSRWSELLCTFLTMRGYAERS